MSKEFEYCKWYKFIMGYTDGAQFYVYEDHFRFNKEGDFLGVYIYNGDDPTWIPHVRPR